MSESQFGFRPGRGTFDAIFILRQLIENAKEHKVPLHFNFIDFKAAFDTIWRKALWKMLLAIGVDPRIVHLIENMYNNTECAVIINGQLTDWFEVKVGVRQGCLLSPILFNIFLEFVMNELKDLTNNSLTLDNNLSNNIRYADDTTLISCIFDKLLLSSEALEEACKKWGMKINSAKCKIISPEDNKAITIDGDPVEHVDNFVFLGSNIPGSTTDIDRRIGMASSAFGRLRSTVWNQLSISHKLKVRLYNALILPIALYASETWTITSVDLRKLETFERRCLRAILGVTRYERLSNNYIRDKLNVLNIGNIVKMRRLKWFDHMARRPGDNYIKSVFIQDFQGNRGRGRPPLRWQDQVRKDTGLPLATAMRHAQDRLKWAAIVRGAKGH